MSHFFKYLSKLKVGNTYGSTLEFNKADCVVMANSTEVFKISYKLECQLI